MLKEVQAVTYDSQVQDRPNNKVEGQAIRARLNGTIQDFVTKALDVHTFKKENQDSRKSRNQILVQFCCFRQFQESQKLRFQILEILVQEMETYNQGAMAFMYELE
ncbi:hypothetical protein PVK06_020433 [Gossypium arboreum]|uniref:Uncharacterized protein n=1 Tax=Gossypium arboreum TaxID=29729 RepID=A0ABR0PMU2_GOSAR|nr:hypothetical protein PVK06_020433 [Gossypium arboreum]